MLDRDIITITGEYSGTVNQTLYTGDFIVKSVAIVQEKELSDTIILADGNPIYKNYAKMGGYVEMNATGTSLTIQKTGNDKAFIIVNLLPYFEEVRTPYEKYTSAPDYLLVFLFLVFLFSFAFFSLMKFFNFRKIK